MSCHIVILGAGISGLSCAWFLKKCLGSNVQVTLLEKSAQVGGWIQTIQQDNFIFEQGPHSCRTKGAGLYTLQLIEELGLQKQVIIGDSSARSRYLYTQQRLQKIPSNLFSFLFSPLRKGCLSAFYRDLTHPKGQRNDESIYDFCVRRFNNKIAQQFVDPLVSGIYAGDMYKLSLKSCFPWLYDLEQRHRSLLWGSFKHKSHSNLVLSPFIQTLQQASLFSFKHGMKTLVQELRHQLEAEIRLNSEVKDLKFEAQGIVIQLMQESIKADFVISTLSAFEMAKFLVFQQNTSLSDLLLKIPYATVTVVNLGYRNQVLKKRGFGYLVPYQEKENILGCIWDSCVFPQKNYFNEETRLTVMIGGTQYKHLQTLTEQEYLSIALDAVNKHLNIQKLPHAFAVKIAKQAIPQYEIGYENLVPLIQAKISSLSKRFQMIGPLINGVSINDCITCAYDSILNTLIKEKL